MSTRVLELLSPAKNRETGMAAINHGADAVYMGVAGFSARTAAGNEVGEIEKLAKYAHFYNARLYVALNTILYDHELDKVEKLIRQLWDAGADALIIQDLGILEMDLPPIPLFASTQMDNRSVSQVQFLEAAGFARVILARELPLKAIRDIRKKTAVDLEAFVHGALCACYSGRCYFSAAIGKRSANRGECAQPCRLAWNLITGGGHVLEKERFLLSLKDMNRSDYLYDLIQAGVTSFKIEGRLKDLAYVKNITAFYRKKLDDIMDGRPGYRAASSGKTELFFSPDPQKTFNRGQTDYLLSGKNDGIASLDTPKAMGEPAGKVHDVDHRYFTLKGGHDLHNGDGLCFIGPSGKLQGFNINRTENEKIYPAGYFDVKKSGLLPGTLLYRNHDHAFHQALSKDVAKRRIAVHFIFYETGNGFALRGLDEDGTLAEVFGEMEKIEAINREKALPALKKQLTRLGDSLFYLTDLQIHSKPYFLPAKVLNQLRRDLLALLAEKRQQNYQRQPAPPRPEGLMNYGCDHLDYSANVSNRKAEAFYLKQGVIRIDPAFEITRPGPGAVVMTLRHCILKALGQCRKEVKTVREIWKDPLFLENTAGRFLLEFDCARCEMRIRLTG